MQTSPVGIDQLKERIRECVACSYSLEGLARDGVCPECGRAYRGDEFRVNGISGVLIFSALGSALLLACFVAVSRFFYFDMTRMAVHFLGLCLVLSIIIGICFLIGSSGAHLLLLHDELRMRLGARTALAFRWDDVSHVSLRRGPVGWMLTFHVSSLAFRPRFHFRADRRRAEALRDFIAQRAGEARSRRSVLPPRDAPSQTDVRAG